MPLPSGSVGSVGFQGNLPFRDNTLFGLNGAWKFPNPFYDVASEFIPTNINNIFEWCEYIYLSFGTWRSASRKVVRYFLTSIELEGESDEERKDFEDFLNDDLHIMTQLAHIGDDFMTYGNVFISIYFPFDRWLMCPQCSFEYHNEAIDWSFQTKTLHFNATCASCGYNGPFNHEDRRRPDRKGVKLIRWNPKEIRMRVHKVSGETEYYWELPSDFVRKLNEGNKFYVKSTPWKILECLRPRKRDYGMPMFKFDKDGVYHFKEATLSGIPVVGWGIPPLLPNFKLAYYIQVLRRFDEAIAHDFIVPFRVIYPDHGPSTAQDPLTHYSSTLFTSNMQQMVQRHRLDPTLIEVAPFRIGYQMLGGEGKTLTPKDQIMQALDELLNAMGYPAELYKGSLAIQAFPVALRLFEKTWGSLVDDYNDMIGWICRKVSHHFMWGEITGKLLSVTLADDIERKALSLQGAAGMDISKGTAYMPFGIDYMEEQRRVVEEQEAIQQLQQKAMDEAAAQQGMPGAAGGGGAPGGGAGGEVGATPGDVYAQAQQLAQQLLFQTPETLRRGELIKIKHSNPTLHALVMQEMDNLRQEMSRQGGAMMMDQQKQQMQEAGGGMVAQAGYNGNGNGKLEMPSPAMIGYLLADQVVNYTPDDMQKIALDIRNGMPGAQRAFHYVYGQGKGWG